MRGFPAEGTLEFFFAGHQNCRFTRTAGTQFARDFAAGDALGDIDALQDREAVSVAGIEGFTGNLADFLMRAVILIGIIDYTAVGPDTRSCGSWVSSCEYCV